MRCGGELITARLGLRQGWAYGKAGTSARPALRQGPERRQGPRYGNGAVRSRRQRLVAGSACHRQGRGRRGPPPARPVAVLRKPPRQRCSTLTSPRRRCPPRMASPLLLHPPSPSATIRHPRSPPLLTLSMVQSCRWAPTRFRSRESWQGKRAELREQTRTPTGPPPAEQRAKLAVAPFGMRTPLSRHPTGAQKSEREREREARPCTPVALKEW